MNRLIRFVLALALGSAFLTGSGAAQVSKPAPSAPAAKGADPKRAEDIPTTSSVFYRPKGASEWAKFGIYSSEEEGRSVFRHLATSGYQVELRISNVQVPKTPARTPTGLLPVAETVTLKKAKDAFDWLAGQPDIAFRFPIDGCYARAHLMCQRMQKNGFKPRKVWAFANGESLYARTKNHPAGHVTWGYHVAPILRVRFENNTQRWYVLDPSLFAEPVPLADWEKSLVKGKESHRPYLTLTVPGQAPKLLDGHKAGGTGYWPSSDPKEGPDAHATAVMKKYKPYEGKEPPKGVVHSGQGNGAPVARRQPGADAPRSPGVWD